MSVLIVGSTALDSIKTPKSENPRLLGGSASHAAVAASFFSPVKLIGVVGDDFAQEDYDLLASRSIDLAGLEAADGETFRWKGYYEYDMNQAHTLDTRLAELQELTLLLEDDHDPLPAAIDRASRWYTFTRITLPLVAPGAGGASRRWRGAPPSDHDAQPRARAAGSRRSRTRSTGRGHRPPTGSGGCDRILPSSRRHPHPPGRR